MEPRPRAASLVTFTVVLLVIYVPLETWSALPALWDPFYLVDFAAMALLACGVVRCRREASPHGLTVLAAAYGWGAANAWRALFARVADLTRADARDIGAAEWTFVGVGTIAMLVGLIWALWLAERPAVVAARASTTP